MYETFMYKEKGSKFTYQNKNIVLWYVNAADFSELFQAFNILLKNC